MALVDTILPYLRGGTTENQNNNNKQKKQAWRAESLESASAFFPPCVPPPRVPTGARINPGQGVTEQLVCPRPRLEEGAVKEFDAGMTAGAKKKNNFPLPLASPPPSVLTELPAALGCSNTTLEGPPRNQSVSRPLTKKTARDRVRREG